MKSGKLHVFHAVDSHTGCNRYNQQISPGDYDR